MIERGGCVFASDKHSSAGVGVGAQLLADAPHQGALSYFSVGHLDTYVYIYTWELKSWAKVAVLELLATIGFGAAGIN